MSTQLRHSGTCFCGSVSYTVTGNPTLSAFCHCTRCQRMNGRCSNFNSQFSKAQFTGAGAAFIWTIHFPATAFTWTHSEPHSVALKSYAAEDKPWKTRYRCKNCGACVASRNTKTESVSVWGVQLERHEDGATEDLESVRPTAHIFYATRIVDVQDSLGKWEGYEGSSPRMLL